MDQGLGQGAADKADPLAREDEKCPIYLPNDPDVSRHDTISTPAHSAQHIVRSIEEEIGALPGWILSLIIAEPMNAKTENLARSSQVQDPTSRDRKQPAPSSNATRQVRLPINKVRSSVMSVHLNSFLPLSSGGRYLSSWKWSQTSSHPRNNQVYHGRGVKAGHVRQDYWDGACEHRWDLAAPRHVGRVGRIEEQDGAASFERQKGSPQHYEHGPAGEPRPPLLSSGAGTASKLLSVLSQAEDPIDDHPCRTSPHAT